MASTADSGAAGASTSTHDIPRGPCGDEGMDVSDPYANRMSTLPDRDSNFQNGSARSAALQDTEAETGWEKVLSLREKKRQARERKNAPGEDTSSHLTDKLSKQRHRPRRRRLPPLPRQDLKVVIRPHQGLPLKNISSQGLARAVVEACQNKIRSDNFILRIKPGSNIAVVSTPEKEDARMMQNIKTLNINGRPHPVNAYVTTGEGAVRGVVHGIEPHTSPAVLKANLRIRTQGVEVVEARMLGDSQSAVITFFGNVIPRYVYYYGGEKACHPYRNATQVCKTCCSVGHRTDVCPQPDLSVCRVCGLQDPPEGHECSPKCAACGEDHPTGDRSCRRRLKPVRLSKKTPLAKRTPRWFASEDEDSELEAYPGLWSEHRRSCSRSRSRERTWSGQPVVQPRPRSQSRPGNQQQQHPIQMEDSAKAAKGPLAQSKSQHNQVSWAQVASHTAKPNSPKKAPTPITQNPEYLKIVEENRALKSSLAELRAEFEAFRRSVAHNNTNARTQADTNRQVITATAHTQAETSSPTTTLDQVAQNVQRLFAEIHTLKRHVDDSIASVRAGLRKRTSVSPGAPTRGPKGMDATDSDSTIHG